MLAITKGDISSAELGLLNSRTDNAPTTASKAAHVKNNLTFMYVCVIADV
jgi:hypothetical protein